MAKRIPARRGVDHSRQQRGVLKTDVAQVLAKIDFSALAQPLDAEASGLAKRNGICVVLENLLLGELLLQVQRNQSFGNFAAQTALDIAQPNGSRKLLRQCGAAHRAAM